MNPLKEQILRDALFIPCKTKEDLHRWIKIYLNIDLPNVIICDDEVHHPPSNSSPMDLIWEMYMKCLDGQDPNFQEILAYASRDSFKTLSASIIEVLCLLHLKRDIVHLAAIEQQAGYCLGYVKKYLSRPILKEFLENPNKRGLTVTRYVGAEGQTISPIQYARLNETDRFEFTQEQNKFYITVATVEACNGLHAPFMCVTGDTEISVNQSGLTKIEDFAQEYIGKELGEEDFEVANKESKLAICSMNADTSEFGFNKVTRIKRKKSKTVKVKISIENNKYGRKSDEEFRILETTSDHKFFVKALKGYGVKGWWVPAEELKVGWELHSLHDMAKVVYVRNSNEEKWVYDLAVENDHTFVANDIVIHNCMDELDIAPPAAFMEAKSIPSSTVDRKLPMTFYTSTRKYSYGLVQSEIDRSIVDDTKLQIRHWNLIDVTEACPPERHLPKEPQIDIYVNEDQLSAISAKDYADLPDTDKNHFEQIKGFEGCLKNCKIFAACKGRLATKQTSKSPMLKQISATQSNIRKVSLEHAKAQYLCWKPSTAGLVYPYFNREVHEKTAGQIAEIFTGEARDKNFDKKKLIKLLLEHGAQFFSGIDWGFTHNFVVVTGAAIGHYLFIIDVIVAGELEMAEMLDITKQSIGHLNPIIFPDGAYPANIKAFRSAGYTVVDFKKEVIEGVKSVRDRIAPGMGKKPNMYFLEGDVGVGKLIKELQTYHWKLDKGGNLTDDPDKVEDDCVDALRYLCVNTQINKSRFIIGTDAKTKMSNGQVTMDNFLRNKISELTSSSGEEHQIVGDGDIKFII